MHNSKTFDRIKTVFAVLILGFFVTAFATGITIDQNDIFQFGKYNSSADHKIVFNKGLGSSNPAIRVGSPGVVEIAHDGSSFSKVVTQGVAPTFAGAVTISPTSSQLVLGTTNTTTISATAPSASRVYTLPDVGSSANFVLDVGASSFGGSRTFSSAVNITPVSNQLVLGTTNTVTLNGAAPSASRVYTFPDAGASANVVLSEGNATINGVKTHSSQIPISATTNQLVLGTTNTATISAPAPSASRVYTMADPGASATFVMSEGALSINGVKTFNDGAQISAKYIFGGQSVTTSGSLTTTLTATSPVLTVAKGSGTHLIKLPAATALSSGQNFVVQNQSTNANPGSVVITLSDGTTAITSLSQGAEVDFKCVDSSTDAAASFSWINSGETIVTESTADQTVTTSYADMGLSITVPPGTWVYEAESPFHMNTSSGGNGGIYFNLALTDSANAISREAVSWIKANDAASGAADIYSSAVLKSGQQTVTSTSGFVRKIRMRYTNVIGVSGLSVSTGATSSLTSIFKAIRIK